MKTALILVSGLVTDRIGGASKFVMLHHPDVDADRFVSGAMLWETPSLVLVLSSSRLLRLYVHTSS